ncbi:MAG: DUF2064 domain-containing protein [Candidatus Sumerlaeia bacterium]|nr:DUF2064 domain-containing protein [Candidatus Sumerlaeia bacterium]
MNHPDTTALLLVQFPEPGHVKSRLAETIGENEATDVYTLLVEDAVLRLGGGARSGSYRLVLFAGPVNRLGRTTLWLNSGEPPILEAVPQPEGTLGTRLAAGFHWGFEKLKSRRVVILGSDCPALDSSTVEQAMDLLDHHDVVVGKSHDGGFYLLASRVNRPDVFDGLDKGDLPSQLVEKGRTLGLDVKTEELPVCLVVNTEADLNKIAPDDAQRLQKRAAEKGFEFRTS